VRPCCAVRLAAFFLTCRLYQQGCASVRPSVHYPENEDASPLRNIGSKLPNHTAQQVVRSHFSTVKLRTAQGAVRLLFRAYLSVILYLLHLLCLLATWFVVYVRMPLWRHTTQSLHSSTSSADIVLALSTTMVWLLLQQDRGLAVPGPVNPAHSIVTYCYCTLLCHSFMFILLKHSYRFQVGILAEGVLRWDRRTIYTVCQSIAEGQTWVCFVDCSRAMLTAGCRLLCSVTRGNGPLKSAFGWDWLNLSLVYTGLVLARVLARVLNHYNTKQLVRVHTSVPV
jgi:hypothetical protein